jgi:hypothetical protein
VNNSLEQPNNPFLFRLLGDPGWLIGCPNFA